MAGFAIRFTSPSRNPATAKPARGKGAKGGRKEASLAARPGASGSGTPLPFPSPSPRCPGFSCERRGQNSATGRAGRVRPRSRAAPGSMRGAGGPRGSGAERPNPLGRRWARPLFRSRASVAGTACPDRGALSSGYETLDFDQHSPSVAEAEQVSDSVERNDSTSTIRSAFMSGSSRAGGPLVCAVAAELQAWLRHASTAGDSRGHPRRNGLLCRL
jgi:hypothetical protein